MRELTDKELDAVSGGGNLVTIGNVGNVRLNLAVPTVVQTNLASQVGVNVFGGVNKLTAAAANIAHIHL